MEIQTRATIIKAFDGTKVIVPNAQLFKNVVVSKTSNPFRKLSFVMGVGYGSDLKQVMNLTLDIIKSIPHVLASPKPSVIFYEWGDYSINFRINVWIDSKGGRMVKVKNHLIMELTKAYDQVGFNVPYPIQTIQLDKADQAEIKKDEIKERVAKMRSQLANGKPPKDPVKHYIVTPIASTPGPASLATTLTPQQPSSAPAPLPVNPSPEPQKLPTAIATTPNSPGQSWLQQALQTQVAQTAAPSVETPPSPVPAATIPPTQTDIQPSVS
jgi:hypothetical protein